MLRRDSQRAPSSARAWRAMGRNPGSSITALLSENHADSSESNRAAARCIATAHASAGPQSSRYRSRASASSLILTRDVPRRYEVRSSIVPQLRRKDCPGSASFSTCWPRNCAVTVCLSASACHPSAARQNSCVARSPSRTAIVPASTNPRSSVTGRPASMRHALAVILTRTDRGTRRRSASTSARSSRSSSWDLMTPFPRSADSRHRSVA